MTITRELLADLGFTRGKGGWWKHETWVWDGMLWVHFGPPEYNPQDYDPAWISAETPVSELLSRVYDAFTDGQE